jgi:tetratricopeptide (TPR) repeat protein
MRLLCLCLLLFSSMICNAQLQGQPLIDSVLKDLSVAKVDTARIKLLNILAFNYKSIDPNEGIKYALQQLEISKAINRKGGIASAYNSLGLNYQYKSDYPTALKYYHYALEYYSADPKSTAYGSIISNIAYVYQTLGDFDKALEYNFKSLAINQASEDSVNIGGDYGNIGNLYLDKKEYDKALEYDFKSLEIFEQLGDKDGIAHNYGNIGNVYNSLKNFPKALEYDKKALDLFTELGDTRSIAINLGNLGIVYVSIAKEDDAPGETNRILPSGTKRIFLQNAIDYLKKSIDLSKKIEQLDNIIEFSHGLYEAYMMLGNADSALASFKEYTLYKDSVYSNENKVKIAGLETERELAIKDKEIQIEKLEVAQKRNERIILFIALGLLLIVVGVVIKKFLNQKKFNQQLSKEKSRHLERIELQRSVMGDIAHAHSHEVSGQVATILGLVEVFNLHDYTDPDNKVVLDGIAETASKLDIIVKDMIIKENLLNTEQKKQSGRS